MRTGYHIILSLILTGSGASTEEEQPIPPTEFSALVNGVAIEAVIEYAKLTSVVRRIELMEGLHDRGYWFRGWAMQGKFIPGLGLHREEAFVDLQEVTVIRSITVTWDGIPQEVPEDLFDHVAFPHSTTKLDPEVQAGIFFIVDPHGDAIIVDVGVGDGSFRGGFAWLFTKEGRHESYHRDLLERW